MSENTKIEWCDHTFNAWEGCQETGPGCKNCYAEARNARFGGGTAINFGPGAPRRRTSAANWALPKRWNAQADAFMAQHGRRQRVFCASLADVFDNAVDPQWRADLFELIRATPNLDWLLLTKRIGNVGNMLPVPFDFDRHFPNVWIGATIVNQAEADRDIPKLLQVPARVRFLSMEPLLGPVDLTSIEVFGGDAEIFPLKGTTNCVNDEGEPADDVPALDWVIVGGESGPGARPMHPDWARSLRDQCEAAGVPFLFKQWGEWADISVAGIGASGPITNRAGDVMNWMRQSVTFTDGSKATVQAHSWTGHATDLMYRIGKKATGRLLDGRTWDGFPS